MEPLRKLLPACAARCDGGQKQRKQKHIDEEAAWNQGDGPTPTWAASPGGAEGKGSAVSQTHVLPCKKKERRKKERSWGNLDQKASTIWGIVGSSLSVGHPGPLSHH